MNGAFNEAVNFESILFGMFPFPGKCAIIKIIWKQIKGNSFENYKVLHAIG